MSPASARWVALIRQGLVILFNSWISSYRQAQWLLMAWNRRNRSVQVTPRIYIYIMYIYNMYRPYTDLEVMLLSPVLFWGPSKFWVTPRSQRLWLQGTFEKVKASICFPSQSHTPPIHSLTCFTPHMSHVCVEDTHSHKIPHNKRMRKVWGNAMQSYQCEFS